ALVVVPLLDRRSHDPRQSDSVAAHYDGLLSPRLIQVCRVQRHGVLGAELEYIPNFDNALDVERAVAVRAPIALLHLPDVGELGPVVAARLDSQQVIPGAVRSADELPVAQRLIGEIGRASCR